MGDGNPQVEDGYVKIANELMQALIAYRLSGEEMKCFLFILMRTYGFKRTECNLELTQFVMSTGMKKPNICRAISKLETKNLVVVIKKDNARCSNYRINKKYNTWQPLSKKITTKTVIKIDNIIKKDNDHYQNRQQPLSKKITDINKKDKFKDKVKYKSGQFSLLSPEYTFSYLLFQLIRSNYSNFKKPNLQDWALEVDRAIRLDGRKLCQLFCLAIYAQQHSFWFKNIRSTAKLRKNFDALWMEILAQKKQNKSRIMKSSSEIVAEIRAQA